MGLPRPRDQRPGRAAQPESHQPILQAGPSLYGGNSPQETTRRALARRKPDILNSDQGSHFTSPQFIDLLKGKEVRISMDGKGRATDNIVIERFWRSLKYNEIYINDYNSPRETRQGVERYIHLHNHYLPHQSLQNHTPAAVYNRDVILLSTSE